MLHRIDPYRLRLETDSRRVVPATVFLPPTLIAEDSAIRQLSDVATLDPDSIVLATPDIHCGYGVPIGSVFASPHYVSPAAVGYDINCGMRLFTTPLRARDVDVARLADAIRREIPLGEGKSNLSVSAGAVERVLQEGVPALLSLVDGEASLRKGYERSDLERDLLHIESGGALPGRHAAVPSRAIDRGRDQLGTLGGGNHFIELQRVDHVADPGIAAAWGLFEGQLVVMIHSGSRGLGHEVGGVFMREAAELCRRERLPMPNQELAYMPAGSEQGKRYIDAMHAAANYAFANRQLMAQLARRSIRQLFGAGLELPTVYDVAHNITKQERHQRKDLWVHRKGATRAFPGKLLAGTPFEATGQPVLIPGSMGTSSYLLVGVETGFESLYSVNHGAGRRMSRTAASGVGRRGKTVMAAAISDLEFRQSMQGVYLLCEDRRSIKEEAPAAYKDIDQVVETVAGAGLARIVARMKPLAVLKG